MVKATQTQHEFGEMIGKPDENPIPSNPAKQRSGRLVKSKSAASISYQAEKILFCQAWIVKTYSPHRDFASVSNNCQAYTQPLDVIRHFTAHCTTALAAQSPSRRRLYIDVHFKALRGKHPAQSSRCLSTVARHSCAARWGALQVQGTAFKGLHCCRDW